MPPSIEIPADIARLDRDALDHRLAKAEAKLDELLPVQEHFELDGRTPANEARARKILGPLFTSPEEYDVECHGTICKIESRARNGWQQRIQTDLTLAGKVQARQVGDGYVYAYLADPGSGAAINLVANLFVSLHTSPAVAACETEHHAPGTILFKLRFDATTPRLTVTATGAIADQSVGICIRRVLEDLIAKSTIPPELTSIPDEPIPFEVP